MIRHRVFILGIAIVIFCLGAIIPAHAQSVLDTFRIVSTSQLPGDSVAVKFYIANHTKEVGALNFIIGFDSTYISPAYLPDHDHIYSDMTERGIIGDYIDRYGTLFHLTQFYFTQNNIVSQESSISGVFMADFYHQCIDSLSFPYDSVGIWDYLPIGSGNVFQIWFHVKPDAPLGGSAEIYLYNEEGVGGRKNQYSDTTGTAVISPTLVSGHIKFEGGPGPEENKPPYFTQPAQTVFNVTQGGTVQFAVAAADSNAGQPLTLSMTSGPSGASFQSANGNGSVSSTFTWTPNYSQVGSFNALFRVVDDSSASAQLAVTINVETEPVENDYLFTTSKEGGYIEGGIPGAVDVSVPVNLSDLNVLYGVEFDVAYNYTVMTLDSVIPSDRLENFEVYSDVIGAGIMRVVSFGLNNETVQPPTESSAIFYCWFSIFSTASPGMYPFTLSNGRASLEPGVASHELEVDSAGFVAVDRFGDVNLDTHIDVGDLVTVVGYIIGDYSLDTRQFRAGDVNADLYVNVVDLVAIINVIFTGSPAPFPKSVYAGEPAEIEIVVSDRFSDGIAVGANLPVDIAGVQFDLKYDPDDIELGNPELTEFTEDLEFRYSDIGEGLMRVLIFFPPSNRERIIEAGSDELVWVPVYGRCFAEPGEGSVTLENTVLSDPNGQEIPVAKSVTQLPATFQLSQNYPNPFNPETRISFSINGQGIQPVRLVVYNILGQKVATLLDKELAPGNYETTWDGTNSSGEKQASGVYFYSLSVGNSRETKKMVLAK